MFNKSIDQTNQGFPKRLKHEHYQTTSLLNLDSFPSEERMQKSHCLTQKERASTLGVLIGHAWSCRFLLLAHMFFHLHLITYLLDVVRIRVPCSHFGARSSTRSDKKQYEVLRAGDGNPKSIQNKCSPESMYRNLLAFRIMPMQVSQLS